LQLRGGSAKRGMDLKVVHLAEAMRRNLKPS
jgi:hypothetical protein